MKIFLNLFLICVSNILFAQINPPGYIEDYHFPPAKQSTSLNAKYAPYGGLLTPKGNARVLIICAGFGEPWDSYGIDNWPIGSNTLPNWAADNKATYYSNLRDFTTTDPDDPLALNKSISSLTNNTNKNISKFYYDMSSQKFKLLFSVYPNRINIDASGSSSWGELNRKVMEKMKIIDPNYDFSPFDGRTNSPNYEVDNSITLPDNKPDYVVIVYRFNRGWSSLPNSGMNSWMGGGFSGYAALDGLNGFSYNGYSFDCGYTNCVGTSDIFVLFIHEFAHSFFDSPHYSNANEVVGNYFYGQSGWGMMSLASGPFSCALGWERWYLDWISLQSSGINSDIRSTVNLPTNGEFVLRDFITTGDVVRIKIPNSTSKNQYLWLENHKGLSNFDYRLWDQDGCSIFPSSPKGLMAYIESVQDDKTQPYIFENANAIKYINSKGNYDYSFSDAQNSCNYYWGNVHYNINEGGSNPISGQSRSELIRSDYNNNGTISLNTNSNSVNHGNEQELVAKRNGVITYDFMGSGAAFSVGQKYGISTNPTLINHPVFNLSTAKFDPYILNGISVTVLEKLSNGDIKIKIQFNDVDINNDIRLAGSSIVLSDITGNSNPDLNVLSNVIVTIDKSGTSNRHTKTSNGDFINPTIFTCKLNSLFRMQPNAKVNVINSSSLVLESGSILEINDGAILSIKKGATLQVKNGASLIVRGTGKVEVEAGAFICFETGASINLQDILSVINLRNGYQIGLNPSIPDLTGACNASPATFSKTGFGSINTFSANNYVQNQTFSVNAYVSGYNIFVGTNVTTAKPQGPVYVLGPLPSDGGDVLRIINYRIPIGSNGAHVVFDGEGDVIINKYFEVKPGAFFEAK